MEISEVFTDLGNPFSAMASGIQVWSLCTWWSSWMKSQKLWVNQVKEEASKVQVQCVNEWSACKSMKLALQMMGCKRHSCTCSHLGYSFDPRAISECKSPFISI
jgi:hypothetical protein